MKRFQFISILLFCATFFVIAGCGGHSGSTQNNKVSIGGESSPAPKTSSQQTSSVQQPPSQSSSSVDAQAIFDETGIYPTKLDTYQNGTAELTLNGQLTVLELTVPDSQRGIVKWPVVPGDRGDENVVWFKNVDLNKALDQSIKNKEMYESSGGKLKFTEVRANAYESGSLRGFMDVTFNQALTVKGIKLMQSDGEYWIAWPSVEVSDGNYVDLVAGTKDLKETLIKTGRKEMGL